MDRKETKRKITNQEELKEPAGGWPSLSGDAYTAEDYFDAGIIWRHRSMGKDEYINKYTEESISQSEAEWRTKAFKEKKQRLVPAGILNDFLEYKMQSEIRKKYPSFFASGRI